MRGRVAASMPLVATLAGGLCAPAALAQPEAALRASFAPDRLGANGTVTVAVRISDPAAPGDVPPPLHTLVIHLPPGLTVRVPGAVCPASALHRHGAGGCPASSRAGAGHATLVVNAGSQTIREPSLLSAFRGPSAGGHPTLEILGVGNSPLQQRSVSRGVLAADAPPYGSRLTISVPAIPTLALEPDASFSSMTLTVGSRHGSQAGIVVPRSCPAGGFRFAAGLGFAGGAKATAETVLACP